MSEVSVIRQLGSEFNLRLPSIQLALKSEALSQADFQRVADFGAGYGTSVRALLSVSREASITALESNREYADEIVKNGILPECDVVVSDGIEHLSQSGSKYSLVTAFGLGPDKSGSLFLELVEASIHALRDGGKLFVESDNYTMAAINDIIWKAGLTHLSILSAGIGSWIVLSLNDCKELIDLRQTAVVAANQ
ncbi:methyltransferase [Candidatus Woesebacteria bacterium]|nr:methyltransferase [Candidatus Woesebacteria bacterium]